MRRLAAAIVIVVVCVTVSVTGIHLYRAKRLAALRHTWKLHVERADGGARVTDIDVREDRQQIVGAISAGIGWGLSGGAGGGTTRAGGSEILARVWFTWAAEQRSGAGRSAARPRNRGGPAGREGAPPSPSVEPGTWFVMRSGEGYFLARGRKDRKVHAGCFQSAAEARSRLSDYLLGELRSRQAAVLPFLDEDSRRPGRSAQGLAAGAPASPSW